MKNFIAILILGLFLNPNIFSQQNKKPPVDFSVYDSWRVTSGATISDDGKWVAYQLDPYKGDGELVVTNPNRLIRKRFLRGEKAVFSPTSKYVAFKVVPQADSVRQLKLKKTKKDKLPKDSLGIWVFKTNKLYSVDNLHSFSVPEESSEWMAYMHTKVDTAKTDKEKKHKDAPKVYDLVISNPLKNKEYRFKDVSEFKFSRNGKLIGFIQVKANGEIKSEVRVFDTEKEDIEKIFEQKGLAKKISLDNAGKQSAFIFSQDSTKNKVYSLHFWSAGTPNSSEIIIDTNSLEMPKDWAVSEHGSIWFSRNDLKMYFGTALMSKPEPEDTLLKEEKINVDVWSWKDPLLQTQQLVELKKELKRNYLTVYHIKNKQVARLASELIPDVRTLLNGNANVALGVADKAFKATSSWQYPYNKDYYLVDLKTGDKQIVLEKTTAETGISPFGKYVFWFDRTKKAWFTKNTKTLEVKNLTSGLDVNFYDEEYDYPTEVPSYGHAGWTNFDEYFLVYDRFDIWKIDPSGEKPPVLLTKGLGRQTNTQLRYVRLDKDISYIETGKKILLRAFNKKNKQSGYYSLSLDKRNNMAKLVMGDFNFFAPIKAKKDDQLIWRKSSVKEFPDYWYSNINFNDPIKISNTNPQQEKYNWATVELVKWKTFDGKEAEGLLYKPENFDPNKKYPMMVYFYRLYSDRLHNHYYPKPSRSTINILFYASNGYLVFIPNIRYQDGYPGKSAYNYIVSGTKAMASKSFVDEKNIGIQGQSWGGYQSAFVITQTNLYKAAAAGAPVSNMTSAYGGIRWKSGMSRMFQYENTQSRIGKTLWEKPELYFKNSPLFYADKVETPLLIVHNDGDGAVPWYQGIELFVALRRLKKPVWLLNYNGEPHNLRNKSPNSKDLSKRMFQYFNHYLKGEPAPVWLEKGIPAIKKGKTLGYEFAEDGVLE